jgi:hypothetical protein
VIDTLERATNLFLQFVSVLPSSLIAFFSWVVGIATFVFIIQFIRGWLA